MLKQGNDENKNMIDLLEKELMEVRKPDKRLKL
jgi:hypothetical protein